MQRVTEPLRQLLGQWLYIAVLFHGVGIEVASQHEGLAHTKRRIHTVRSPRAALGRILVGVVGDVLRHRNHQLVGAHLLLWQPLENLLLHEEHIHRGQHPASLLGCQHIPLADGHIDLQRNYLRFTEERMPILRCLLLKIGAHDRIRVLGRAGREAIPGKNR
jgi:hypothetical protein